MFVEKAIQLVSNIPLSNNTVVTQISDMTGDVKETLLSHIKCSKFALQMNELTDVAMGAFFADHYQPTHQGVKYLILWTQFFSSNEIPWENCADICTDGVTMLEPLPKLKLRQRTAAAVIAFFTYMH
ncbi:hypothetical protein PR048_008555 [Dryococelus australis]|uniref:Uncharacterized protein n=1 Tax=Dryococelus australis TaxID=614101 RepID=A0ABQ9HXF7_9NEOP|nr:hypothetical protein PR048_008555 [Dryococelus australis]